MKFGLRNLAPLAPLHWSAVRLKYRAAAFTPPASVDYLSALPGDLGMMGNDNYGDCFEAALYHGDQVHTKFAGGAMLTQSDTTVLSLYSAATGFNPNAAPNADGDNPTDQGSDAKATFDYVTAHGLPRAQGPAKLLAAFEIDPRNIGDVMEAMDACGSLMVGFDVPASLEAAQDALVWDYVPGNASIVGGHEVLVGKQLSATSNLGLISWGNPRYEMTLPFWMQFVRQVTACVWDDWVMATGKTPFNMTTAQLTAEMASIQSGAIC
jgi:hypothetical protein